MESGPTAFDDAVRSVRAGELDADAAADSLIAELSDHELLGLLDGDSGPWVLPLIPWLLISRPFVAGAVTRLGIPGIRFSDGARGVVIGRSTAFPVAMARAATWDPALEQQVGRAIGLETRARGANYSASVCVNLLRHPAWGRAQECYGEDPVLTARMGTAATRGVQANAMACVKHFALNSMEDMRFEVDVSVDEHALHEVYLPHFKAIVDAGAASLMTAYNQVRGRYMDVNAPLLTDVLRTEWGFEGFVSSDWVFGTHDAVASLQAGMEIEMPLRLRRARELPHALRTGRLDRPTVLQAAHRILRTTLLHYAHRDADEPGAAAVASPEHRALARRVAAESIVLLKNEPVGGAAGGAAAEAGGEPAPLLPLSPGIRSIAVVGRLADRQNLGDHGSSRVRPPSTVSPLRGLREALPGAQLITPSRRGARAAAAAARRAEVAIVVVGLDQHDEGESVLTDTVELGVLGAAFTTGFLRGPLSGLVRLSARFVRGGDRRSLALRASDIELIEAVTAANPRTAVVLIGGSAILTAGWSDRVPALAMAWYGGMEGGRALADVLTGAAEPTGRLPFAIPTDEAHLTPFDRTALHVVYDGSWGQRKLDADGHIAAFPFGYGLGYTALEHELVSHRFDDAAGSAGGTAAGSAEVRVRNPGDRDGTTVIQLYAADVLLERPVSQLLGFQKVTVPAGGEAVIQVELDATPTLQRDPATHAWSPRPGDWRLLAAQHSPVSWSGALPLRRPTTPARPAPAVRRPRAARS